MSKSLARTADMAEVVMPQPNPNLNRSDRVNFYHHVSKEAGKISIIAALHAGLELIQAREECEVGMYEAWVRANCPFSRMTANRYTNLVTLALGESATPALLEMDETHRRLELESASADLDARNLQELYTDLGIVKPVASRMGGKRQGAGRKPTNQDPDAQTSLTIKTANALLKDLRDFAITDNELANLPDEVLSQWLTELSNIVDQGQALAKARLAANRKAKAKK